MDGMYIPTYRHHEAVSTLRQLHARRGTGPGMALLSQQLRAARHLLRMEQQELARRADVPVPTVKRIENAPGPVRGKYDTVAALRRALEEAGIEFIEGDRPGVRFAEPPKT